jgi:hypothetical protein
VTQQIINVGAAPNDGTGDPARTAFTKCNANFSELYGAALAAGGGVPQEGRLAYVGPTVLRFAPANGNKIKINATVMTIPNAGIVGLGNTGVRVNNVPGSSLAADTTYWVFAENVAGTVTGHFWTVAGGLASPHHRPSQTAGNEGVETWYNGTELAQFTLIGICRTNASSQFQDSTAVRGVLSWFNRRIRIAQGQFSIDRYTTSTVFVEINPEIAIGFLMWGESATLITSSGASFNSGVGSGFGAIFVDGVQLAGITYATSAGAGYGAPLAIAAALGGLDAAVEGYHSATLYGKTFSGTQTYVGVGGSTAACTLLGSILG